MYRDTVAEVWEVVAPYTAFVPKIMVTQEDESVLEIEAGRLAWPNDVAVDLARLRLEHPADLTMSAAAYLPTYLEAVRAARQAAGAGGACFTALRAAETRLLALAAAEGLNVVPLGYQSAELVITEVEER